MKKIVYAIAALALIFTGCAKELDNSTKDNFSTVRLHVKVADQLTKVSADNDGRYHWQGGDEITVFDYKQASFVFSTEKGGSDVYFGATSWSGEDLGKYAMYPASSHSVSGNVVGFNLPSSYKWKANSTNMPMLGKINEDVATFKAVGGVLKLVCYNVPADAVKMEFSATNKKISGSFNIDNAAVENPIIVTAAMAESNNKVSFDFTGDRKDNMVFYIPLPTGTIDGFTVSFLSDVPEVVFTKTSTKSLSVSRNRMIIAPALDCDPTIVLWRESFKGYSTGTYWGSATAMSIGSSYDAEKYGDATITYKTSGGSTNIQSSSDAGGVSPELQITKDGGTFTVSGLPTNGAETMSLTFRENYDDVTVTSTSTHVTVSGSFATKVYTATVSNPDRLSTINLVFTNSTSYNVKFDDPLLQIAGTSVSIPTITSGNVNLTIGIGSLSKSTSVGIDNPVDDLGLSYVLSKKDDKPMDWISSVVISEGTLTVTATDANGEAEDREAILTLKATGAADKVINLKQTSALVQKPASITTIPGNASMSASWTKAEHATGYLAYLCESSGLADPTGGTALTPSIEGSTVSVSKPSGLSNGTTYYLYVKVNTVDTNYIADSEWTEESVTPENVIYYEKITAVGNLESDVKYLIVNESAAKALDGSVATAANYNVANKNLASVTIGADKIVANSTTNAMSVTISGDTGEYTILTASGFYLGQSSGTGMTASTDTPREHSITFSEGNAVIKDNENDMQLRYNSTWTGFRYYTGESVNPVQLYKYNDPRTPAGIEWQKSGVKATTDGATMLTGADTMPTIVLDNPHGLTVSFTSSDPTVATVISSSSASSVSAGAIATLLKAGTATITASFADGDATYRPATVKYTVTVTDSRDVVATPSFSDVTETYPDVNVLAAEKDITISCGTVGATVYYTTDNSSFDPSSWTQSNTVHISGLTTIRAVAVKDDHQNSAEGIVSYRIAGGSASPLPDPSGVAITAITASTLTGIWTNNVNASNYEWTVSTSSTYAGITVGNTIASGDTGSSGVSLSEGTYTVSLTSLDLSGLYYFYVKAKGDGVIYSDSENASSVSKGILTLNQSGLNTPASYSSTETVVTIGGFNFASIQTMKSTTSIQGKASVMKIYNKSSLGKVKSVVVTQAVGKTYRAGTLYVGDAVDPSTTKVTVSQSGSVATYNVTGDYGFFTYKNTSSNAMYIDNIVVVFE